MVGQLSFLCECHNQPLFWEKDDRAINGGVWRCRIKKRIKDSRYDRTPKGYVRKRIHQLRVNREQVLSKLKEIELGRISES